MRKMAELQYGNPVDLAKLSAETGIPIKLLAEMLGLERSKKQLGRLIPFKLDR